MKCLRYSRSALCRYWKASFKPEPPERPCVLLPPRTAALRPLRRTIPADLRVKFTLNQTDLVFNYFYHRDPRIHDRLYAPLFQDQQTTTG